MNRGLLALLALLFIAACHGDSQSEPGPNPGSEQDNPQDTATAKVRGEMDGVWLFAQPDTPLAGGHFDGIRFDAKGRWQTLDVLEDGSVVPAKDTKVGYADLTVNDTQARAGLLVDGGGGIPLSISLSPDGLRMHWNTDMPPWEYQLERSSAVVSGPIPGPPYIPKSPEEGQALLVGVWLFTSSDVKLGGSQCDGVRFDDNGRYELLDVEADGTIVPAHDMQIGSVFVSTPSTSPQATSVQLTMQLDALSFYFVRSSWSSDHQQMTWGLELGPTVTLRRTNVSVAGTVPPPPSVPTTRAEGLALAEGVWLFPRPDMRLGWKTADGIRFSAEGRWELVDVIDGSVVPAQQALSGFTDFVLPASERSVHMLLLTDTGRPLSTYASWPMQGQLMNWQAYDWTGTLRRSSASVSAPFPPSPYVPRSEAELDATLQGAWLFDPPNKAFLGTAWAGIRFDATGRWQTLEFVDGQLVPTSNSRVGRTAPFLTGTEPNAIELAFRPEGAGDMEGYSSWNGARDHMDWEIGAFSFQLVRSSAVISEPFPW